jgi:hypothetical protein
MSVSTPTLHGNTGGTLSQGCGFVNFLNGAGAQPRGCQIVAPFYSLFSESRNSGQSSSIEHIQAGTSRDEPTWHTDDAILDSNHLSFQGCWSFSAMRGCSTIEPPFEVHRLLTRVYIRSDLRPPRRVTGAEEDEYVFDARLLLAPARLTADQPDSPWAAGSVGSRFFLCAEHV